MKSAHLRDFSLVLLSMNHVRHYYFEVHWKLRKFLKAKRHAVQIVRQTLRTESYFSDYASMLCQLHIPKPFITTRAVSYRKLKSLKVLALLMATLLSRSSFLMPQYCNDSSRHACFLFWKEPLMYAREFNVLLAPEQ